MTSCHSHTEFFPNTLETGTMCAVCRGNRGLWQELSHKMSITYLHFFGLSTRVKRNSPMKQLSFWITFNVCVTGGPNHKHQA